jgi:hypothetical protein
VYIDLSAPRASKTASATARPYTSIHKRGLHLKDHVRRRGKAPASAQGKAGATPSAQLEDSLWLCPIEDRRGARGSHEGMFKALSLEDYLFLADYSAAASPRRKSSISSEVLAILDRQGYSGPGWDDRLANLRSSKLFGRFSAASQQRLREVAASLGVHKVANVGGMPKE